MSKYFPEPYRGFEGNVKVKLDLYSYATKVVLKNAIGVDTSNFSLK